LDIGSCPKPVSSHGSHQGFSAEQVPVSAYAGSSKDLKDLKDLKDQAAKQDLGMMFVPALS